MINIKAQFLHLFAFMMVRVSIIAMKKNRVVVYRPSLGICIPFISSDLEFIKSLRLRVFHRKGEYKLETASALWTPRHDTSIWTVVDHHGISTRPQNTMLEFTPHRRIGNRTSAVIIITDIVISRHQIQNKHASHNNNYT